VADEPTAAGRVALEANAPNPVRDVTTIGFTLGVAGPVRLALYDIAGREVRRLVDGATLEAGPHAVRLDVRDGALPAGLYYYSIEAAGERATRRMVVVP
jgi:hypothetical protein